MDQMNTKVYCACAKRKTSPAVECPKEENGEKGVWRTLEDEERSREADGQ